MSAIILSTHSGESPGDRPTWNSKENALGTDVFTLANQNVKRLIKQQFMTTRCVLPVTVKCK